MYQYLNIHEALAAPYLGLGGLNTVYQYLHIHEPLPALLFGRLKTVYSSVPEPLHTLSYFD